MAVIYKYDIHDKLDQVIEFDWPSTEILMVDIDQKTGRACMWVQHYVAPDISQDKSKRKFVVKGTGELFKPHGLKHIASWQERMFIWHLYEIVT